MNKKKIIRLLWAVIGIVVLFSGISYFYYVGNMPNLALFCVTAGGVIVLNLILAIILVNKNFKENK